MYAIVVFSITIIWAAMQYFRVRHFTSCTVGITHRFHLWPYSHRSNMTYFSIIPRSAQYVDDVLYDFRDGDNPQPSLPNTYCICSSDYTHKTGSKTTAYGTADGLERAIWGPSIIIVFRSPLLYGNLGQTLSSLLPFEQYYRCGGQGRWRCHKTFY